MRMLSVGLAIVLGACGPSAGPGSSGAPAPDPSGTPVCNATPYGLAECHLTENADE